MCVRKGLTKEVAFKLSHRNNWYLPRLIKMTEHSHQRTRQFAKVEMSEIIGVLHNLTCSKVKVCVEE